MKDRISHSVKYDMRAAAMWAENGEWVTHILSLDVTPFYFILEASPLASHTSREVQRG